MTKKHFKAIAEILVAAKPDGPSQIELGLWEGLVEEFADMCAQFNPHFDRSRFFEACGYSK